VPVYRNGRRFGMKNPMTQLDIDRLMMEAAYHGWEHVKGTQDGLLSFNRDGTRLNIYTTTGSIVVSNKHDQRSLRNRTVEDLVSIIETGLKTQLRTNNNRKRGYR
jgi:hypothetical protein